MGDAYVRFGVGCCHRTRQAAKPEGVIKFEDARGGRFSRDRLADERPTDSRLHAAAGNLPGRSGERVLGRDSRGLRQSALLVAALASGPVQGAAVMAVFATASALSLWLRPTLWWRLRWSAGNDRTPANSVRLAVRCWPSPRSSRYRTDSARRSSRRSAASPADRSDRKARRWGAKETRRCAPASVGLRLSPRRVAFQRRPRGASLPSRTRGRTTHPIASGSA